MTVDREVSWGGETVRRGPEDSSRFTIYAKKGFRFFNQNHYNSTDLNHILLVGDEDSLRSEDVTAKSKIPTTAAEGKLHRIQSWTCRALRMLERYSRQRV